jgi:hypothetical protein
MSAAEERRLAQIFQRRAREDFYRGKEIKHPTLMSGSAIF